jgi:hypothetical protein
VVIVYNVMWAICQVRHGQNKVMFFLWIRFVIQNLVFIYNLY